ncbi:MAG: hypothetical protein ABMB14_02205 [Myxococcota bacterium]
MTEEERDELRIEQVAGAWRERSGRGEVRSHPAWHDLDDAGRQAAFDRAVVQRRLEAAANPHGLSATARSVLTRIASGGGLP